MPRKWYKHWVAESLRGTIRFDLTSEERGVWFDLLAMTAESRHEGYIAPNDEQGYPDSWIASSLNITIKLLQRVIQKCEVTGRIKRTKYGLQIINWSKYQSEYDRQKPYRQQQKELSPLAKSLGFTTVEDWDKNEERLKREGKWMSEEEYLAESAEVLLLDTSSDGETPYTKAMFWADNTWFEEGFLAGRFQGGHGKGYDEMELEFGKKYPEDDAKLFAAKFLKERKRLVEQPD